MGAETNYQATNSNCANLKISIGKIKVLNGHQYDKFFSFTQNGGGAEFFFISAKAIPTPNGGYIATPNVRQYKYVNRRAIRNGDWVDVWSTLDYQWTLNNTNQMFGIYEEDNTDNNDPQRYFSANLEYVDGYTSYTYCFIEVDSKNEIVSKYVPTHSHMLNLFQTYGHTPEYLQGFGPQFTSTDTYVRYSLPIGCF